MLPNLEHLTAQVHGNYVDCARWVGDLVVSKSVDDKMLLWLPELEGFEPRALQEGRYTIVQVSEVVGCKRGLHIATVYTLARVESRNIKASRPIPRPCPGVRLALWHSLKQPESSSRLSRAPRRITTPCT